jgi:Flp pilus assembly protein TadG
MTTSAKRSRHSSEEGVALVYMAVTMALLLLVSGLVVDSGRGYLVKAQLTKAVDGAALAAARTLNSGSPKDDAIRVFKANFPPGTLGTAASTDPTTAGDFFTTSSDPATGINTVTVKANVSLPTTFMKLAHAQEISVSSTGQADRRMVDLSLVIDVSGSIGAQWTAVRDATRDFIKFFDEKSDRMALVTYSYAGKVLDPMPSVRGFDKTKLVNDVPSNLPGGVTNMAEGLYRGWDELRTVAAGQQSGIRVIVLFTDGSANTIPGIFDTSGVAKGLFVSDFPHKTPDPGGITTDTPSIQGLYQTQTGTQSPSVSVTVNPWSATTVLGGTAPALSKWLPATTTQDHHRSSGIPTAFPLVSNTVKVDTLAQSAVRGFRNFNAAQGKYPADAWNIRNAATNIVEIMANAARSDAGDYPIRIYTIGMGDLVTLKLGTRPEKSEDVLKRIANDKTSPDFNANQLEGKYYFAKTANDLAGAYQQLQNQIIRLAK